MRLLVFCFLIAVDTVAVHQLGVVDLMAVEIRAVHAGKLQFSETTVLTPNGSVVLETNFIIGIGPMARTSS